MAKNRNDNAVSLFPFLAVLMCTMGALILLLLVTTRRIRQKQQETAVTSAVVENQPCNLPAITAEEISTARTQVLSRQEKMSTLEETLSADSRQQKITEASVSSLQDDIQRLQQELQEAEAAADTVRSSVGNVQTTIDELKEQIDGLQQQLTDARKQQDQVQQELASQEVLANDAEQLLLQRRSALCELRQTVDSTLKATAGRDDLAIDFSNPWGTSRTPIMIELDGDGFVFPATGVRVSRQDLTGFRSTNNPLLSAVQVSHRLRSRSSAVSDPYVLLLVRPEGILDFYPAQRVFTDARLHFGYELLDADQAVAADTAADGEADAAQLAIAETLAHRNRLLVGTTDLQQQIAALRRSRQRSQTAAQPSHDGHRGSSPGLHDVPPPVGPSSGWSSNREASNGTTGHSPPSDGTPLEAQQQKGHSAPSGRLSDREYDQLLADGRQSKDGSGQASGEEGSPWTKSQRRSIRSVLAPGSDVESALERAIASRSGRSGSRGTPQQNVSPRSEDSSFGRRTENRSASAAQGMGRQATEHDRSQDEFWDNLQALPGQPSPDSKLTATRGGGGFGGNGGSSLTFFENVTVYLDPQHLTVVGHSPESLQGLPVSDIIQFLVESLVDVVRYRPRLAMGKSLPAVKFVVSPGAHALYLQLASELSKLNVPVSSVVSLGPYVDAKTGQPITQYEGMRSQVIRTVGDPEVLP